mgnify:CR=1 FL=1
MRYKKTYRLTEQGKEVVEKEFQRYVFLVELTQNVFNQERGVNDER